MLCNKPAKLRTILRPPGLMNNSFLDRLIYLDPFTPSEFELLYGILLLNFISHTFDLRTLWSFLWFLNLVMLLLFLQLWNQISFLGLYILHGRPLLCVLSRYSAVEWVFYAGELFEGLTLLNLSTYLSRDATRAWIFQKTRFSQNLSI